MAIKKNKSPMKLFIGVFAVIVAVMVISTILRDKIVFLGVLDNAGVTVLETIDNSLVCVFQDGRVVLWEWDTLPQQRGDFSANSDRMIILNVGQLATVNKQGKKNLAVYSLPDGQKKKDISVGWADQDIWLRISPDKNVVGLIRRNNPDSTGSALYEFLTVDIEKEFLSSPATLSIASQTEDVVDTTVDNNSILYAVGSRKDAGRIAAVDLQQGSVLWDQSYENTKEFCSCVTSPDGTFLFAGNRDGILYKLDAATGRLIQKIQLLEAGETRPITNDYSVLNLAFSPEGQYYVATINPKAYILKTESDEIVYAFSPADRLVSKIAFSPDSKFIATSDIRAGYPIKIWPLPEK
ncbi:MAG: PQQ-binding-like beta-propeller repeat protein [Phycisphaerae bacterium]|nr:PQQ-binding-like beta-propeller repeat protein [Phycisphaerae bacterium]